MAKIKIFKLPNNHPCKFMGTIILKSRLGLDDKNRIVDILRKDYVKVYDCERKDGYNEEDAFDEFNLDHPSDYKSSSLSVSDIISIDDKYLFCDSIGWIRTDPLPPMPIGKE
jgi:hypothetical protein